MDETLYVVLVTIQTNHFSSTFTWYCFNLVSSSNFESVDEILWCYHSNETSSAVLSHGTIYLVWSSNLEFVEETLWCYHSNETSSAVLSHSTIYLVWSSNLESLEETLWCDHSNATSSVILRSMPIASQYFNYFS